MGATPYELSKTDKVTVEVQTANGKTVRWETTGWVEDVATTFTPIYGTGLGAAGVLLNVRLRILRDEKTGETHRVVSDG